MSIHIVDIIPAILEEEFAEIEQKFKVVSGLVSMVQVDICDGEFVPSVTFGSSGSGEDFEKLKKSAQENDIEYELDMMVNLDAYGRDVLTRWITAIKIAQPQKVVFHFGSTTQWDEVFKSLEGRDIEIGLGIHIDTNMFDAVQLLKKYNFGYVQVMGIEKVGFGGQEFSEKALGKIKELFQEFPFLPVSVDGGVNIESAPKLISTGITMLVAGSAVFKTENPQVAIAKLQGE